MDRANPPNTAALLRDAIVRLREVRARLDAVEREKHEAIAIVGMSCRFPGGANDLASFWQMLRQGRDCITEVPADRWNVSALYDANADAVGKTYTRWGGFLDDIRGFDRQFFGISAREAQRIDPQQRLLLEVTWDALEHAGIAADRLTGRQVGVFAGVMTNDYGTLQTPDLQNVDSYFASGSVFAFMSGRVSYHLGCQGPSLTVDTACSSSLVALHLACQSLRRRECELAIVGGANVMAAPHAFVASSQIRSQARDGRCKTFDAAADGYVRGEGVGALICKRLSDAVADGDHIVAVIRGSAVNHGGSSGGLTVPSAAAQEQVIRAALADARVAPERVSYVEAHGTGTALGDPIEARALGAALSENRPADAVLTVGSVKTNFGHLEAAAGVAGLLKVALALQNEEIPQHLHFQKPNPFLDFRGIAVDIPTQNRPWPKSELARVAGVSSFGLSGTNAHVVLEEAPATLPVPSASVPSESPQLLTLSARSDAALRAQAERYGAALSAHTQRGGRLEDFCAAAARSRSHHPTRLALVGSTPQQMEQALAAFVRGERAANLHQGQATVRGPGKLAFVFSGTGSQWLGMGRVLLMTEPVFRTAIERCDAALAPHLAGWRLGSLLEGEEAELHERIDVIQPALFAISVGLAELWRSWGVEPDAVIGHSMGEVAAAYVAGGLTLEAACSLIALRSRLLMKARGRGAMCLVELSASEVEALLASRSALSIAAINSPTSTVVTGDVTAIDDLLAELEPNAVFCRKVKTDVALHSPQLDFILDELREKLADIQPQSLELPMMSTVSSDWIGATRLDADYWVQNLRCCVQFGASMSKLRAAGFSTFIELSPHPILAPAVEQAAGPEGVCVASLKREQDARGCLLDSLAVLYAGGRTIDWTKVYPGRRIWLDLPTYPWQREATWFPEPTRSSSARSWREPSEHPLLGRRFEPASQHGTCFWESERELSDFAYVSDHRVQGIVLLPAAAFLDVASAALRGKAAGAWLSNVRFERAAVLPEQGVFGLQVALFTDSPEPRIDIATRVGQGQGWLTNVRASVSTVPTQQAAPEQRRLTNEVRQQFERTLNPTDLYDSLRARGLEYGERFRTIQALRTSAEAALVEVALPESLANEAADYLLHPALLDGCLQATSALAGAATGDASEGATFLPVFVEHYRLAEQLTRSPRRVTCLVERRSLSAQQLVCDLTVYDEHGGAIAEMRGLTAQALATTTAAPHESVADELFETQWREQPPAAGSPSPATASSWVVLMDATGVGAAVAAELRARGDRVVTVSRGTRYQQLSAESFELPADDAEGFGRLLAGAGSSGGATQVLHLWSLDSPALDGRRPTTLATARDLTFTSALLVARTLAALEAPARLWLITRHSQHVQATDPINPAQAPAWGLGRTLALEVPELLATNIDLGADPAVESARQLCVEAAQSSWESQLAWRSGRRFVARLEPLRSAAATPTLPALRPDRAYLISGGLGGLGLATARHWVSRGARHLVLLGRSSPNESSARAIEEMRAAGAAVHVVRADVSSLPQLADALGAVAREVPAYAGVVHAAGVLADGTIGNLDAQAIQRVFAPKLDGAWNLHTLLRTPLDFFVLFSSAASSMGAPGQANYAAANAFLDALAHARRAQGLCALSVNWGPFSEVGLAANPDRGGRLAHEGIDSLSPDEGLRALDSLMASDALQTTVIKLHGARWAAAFPRAGKIAYFSEIFPKDAVSAADGWRARLAATQSREAQQLLLVSLISQELSAVLRASAGEIAPTTALTSIGLDSLTGLQLRARLEAHLQLKVPAALLWTDTDVSGLADVLLARLLLEAEGAPARYFDELDLEAEVRSLEQPAQRFERPVRPAPEHVLLTGATGFLGAFLLRELLDQTSAPVTCLVRADSPNEADERIRTNLRQYGLWREEDARRVTAVASDLAQPHFGLASERYSALCKNVDAVYHSAAMYNWLFPYRHHRAANVLGTQNILSFCGEGQSKRLHYVSSLGVFLGLDAQDDRVFRENDDLLTNKRHLLGYLQSKWVAERLVAQARDNGLAATVYRPPLITGDSRSGQCKTHSDFFCHFIKACLELGLAPPDHRGVLTLYPVDWLSRGIVRLSLSGDAIEPAYHLSAPFNFNAIGAAAAELGYPVRQVPYAEWMRAMLAAGPESALHRFSFLFSETLPGSDNTMFSRFGYERSMAFACDATQRELARDGLFFQAANERLFRTYIEFFQQSGFMKPRVGKR